MIDLEYSCYITELLMDDTLTEGLRSRRFDAIRKMRGIAARYEEENFLPERTTGGTPEGKAPVSPVNKRQKLQKH